MKEQCQITIDGREGEFGVWLAKKLIEMKRTNIKIKNEDDKKINLKVGDIEIISPDGKIIVKIERKSVDSGDFIGSFEDGRLERQAFELGEYEYGILLIHGDIYKRSIWKRYKHMKVPDSVTRLLTGLNLKRGKDMNKINVIQVPYKSQVPIVVDYIAGKLEKNKLVLENYKLAKKGKKNKKSDVLRTDPEFHDTTLFSILLQIDRMPKKIAIEILKNCNYDFEVFYRKSEQDFKDLKIKGFGKTLIKLVHETFHKKEYTI